MSSTPRVLLTNDDGPPDLKDSPYIFGFYLHLTRVLGWDVKVVLPNSQKSWIGKAYHINEIVRGNYFYPKEDGNGELTSSSRPLKNGELAEWILIDGTPATCANVALHNLYPNQIDLVISGPNYGRNTSSAFALSSGTIGAAMSSSLSKMRSVALSYGTMVYPVLETYFDPAHNQGCRIINYLWNNWGEDECGLRDGEVDLYSVNIPMIEQILGVDGLKVCWTRLFRNSYGQLFKNVSGSIGYPTSTVAVGSEPNTGQTQTSDPEEIAMGSLLFKWSPMLEGITSPKLDCLPVGSDTWAIHQGFICVTPLRASFGEPPSHVVSNEEDILWKMSL